MRCWAEALSRSNPEALSHFDGMRVRIVPHLDPVGQEAAARWARQLGAAGAVVDAFNLQGLRRRDGKPVKDLNDAIVISPEDESELEGLFE